MMRCWECKDEVSGVGGWGVKISQNGSRLASGVKILRFEKNDFLVHTYATFKANLYLCWSLPLKSHTLNVFVVIPFLLCCGKNPFSSTQSIEWRNKSPRETRPAKYNTRPAQNAPLYLEHCTRASHFLCILGIRYILAQVAALQLVVGEWLSMIFVAAIFRIFSPQCFSENGGSNQKAQF